LSRSGETPVPSGGTRTTIPLWTPPPHSALSGIPIQRFFLGFAHRFSNPFRPISLAASDESLLFGLFFYHDPGSFLLDLLIRDFLIAMGASHSVYPGRVRQ